MYLSIQMNDFILELINLLNSGLIFNAKDVTNTF